METEVQDFKNKNLVVFIYDKSYLKKSETYDMTKELNEMEKSVKINKIL